MDWMRNEDPASALRRLLDANPPSDVVELGAVLLLGRFVAEDDFSCAPALFAQCEELLGRAPASSAVRAKLAEALVACGRPREACGFFLESLTLDPTDGRVEAAFDDAKATAVPRWHFRMLNDAKRNLAYRRALTEALRPGDLALDLGCGTGLLSYYASSAGADVVAVDVSPLMCDIAEAALRRCGADKVRVVNRPASELNVPSSGPNGRIVAVAEMFDAGLLGEGAVDVFADALRRLSADAVVPRKARAHACGIRSRSLAARHRTVNADRPVEDDLSVPRDGPYDTVDLSFVRDVEYVTASAQIFEIDFQNLNELEALKAAKTNRTFRLEVVNKGHIDAFAMWFDLTLSEDVTLTTDPRSSDRCRAWDAAIFHLKKPRQADDFVEITVVAQHDKIEIIDDHPVDDLAVSSEVMRILNDAEYIRLIEKAVAYSCFGLNQVEELKVWDGNPFPLVGLSMLKRGARLYCPPSTRPLMSILSKYNNRVVFVDPKKDVNVYGMYAPSFSQIVSDRRRVDNSTLLIPSRIDMVARLIYSEHLSLSNRVDDANLDSNGVFNVADAMNAYQVSRNRISPWIQFDKKFLSDEFVLALDYMNGLSDKTITVIPSESGFINAVQLYYRIHPLSDDEGISTDRETSHIDNLYYLIEPMVNVTKNVPIDILLFAKCSRSIKICFG